MKSGHKSRHRAQEPKKRRHVSDEREASQPPLHFFQRERAFPLQDLISQGIFGKIPEIDLRELRNRARRFPAKLHGVPRPPPGQKGLQVLAETRVIQAYFSEIEKTLHHNRRTDDRTKKERPHRKTTFAEK